MCTPWPWPGFEIIPDDNTKQAEWFAMMVDGTYDQSSGKNLLELYFDKLETRA